MTSSGSMVEGAVGAVYPAVACGSDPRRFRKSSGTKFLSLVTEIDAYRTSAVGPLGSGTFGGWSQPSRRGEHDRLVRPEPDPLPRRHVVPEWIVRAEERRPRARPRMAVEPDPAGRIGKVDCHEDRLVAAAPQEGEDVLRCRQLPVAARLERGVLTAQPDEA